MNFIYFLYLLLPLTHITRASIIKEDILSPFFEDESIYIRRKNREDKNFVTVSSKNDYKDFTIESFRINFTHGHRAIIYNSKSMFSVLEPHSKGGCKNHKIATVMESSKQKHCLVAVNGGFYNENTGSCYGNVISDQRTANAYNSDVKNVNFGIRQDGSIVIGYLSHEFLNTISKSKNPFLQLITGIGWVLRDGKSFVNESIDYEKCSASNMEKFAQTKSARTFLGVDSNGYTHVVQIDGRTNRLGVNLYDSVDILISFGLLHAINLDGGGSSTFVVNGSLLNYPSNTCMYNGVESLCTKKVGTILCIHKAAECDHDTDCTSYQTCNYGKCTCQVGWYGEKCQFNDSYKISTEWQLYYFIIGLTIVIGLLLVYNIFLCNLFLLYRYRCNELLCHKKDTLRHYLQSQKLLLSSSDSEDENDENDDVVIENGFLVNNESND